METLKFIESQPNELWRPVYDLSDENDVTLNVLIPLIIMLITYWSTSLFFSFVDMKGKPNFITKFKIPDKNGTNYPRTSPQRLRHVAFQVLFNQTVIAVPAIYFCYILKSIIGCDRGYVFPKLHRFVFDFILQILTEEVFFYYSHRILHHPLFYKRFHKRHHEWVSPIGVSAIYCTPVEHVLSNVLPTFLGSVIFKLHVTSLWSWLVFATSYGVIVHSGYHLPFTPTPEFHHYHHHKFTENFGVAGILDWLHGTDEEFRKSKAFERNIVLLSLSPIN